MESFDIGKLDTLKKPEGSAMLAKFKKVAENAGRLMEDEMERGSGNNWMGSFSTVMTNLVGFYELFAASPEFDERKHAVLASKFEDLRETYERVRGEYGNKADIPEDTRLMLMEKVKDIG